MGFLRRVPWWGWFALAASIRVAFVLKLGSRLYQIDEGGVDFAAWGLAQSARLGHPDIPGIWPPVPTFLFGAVYFLVGHHAVAPRLLQAAISAATAVAVGRMTEDLSGAPRAGRLAAAVAAVYPFFIYYSGLLMTETLYVACLVPGLWQLAASVKEEGRDLRRAAASGFFLALAALCRTEAAPITFVLLGLGLVAVAARRWTLKAWTLAVVCWLVPLLGWAARNRVHEGSFTLDAHGGLTLLHGTVVYDLNERLDTGEAMKALEQMPFYREAQSLTPAQRDHVYFHEAWTFMKTHPAETARQWAGKFKNFWRFYPRTDKSYAQTATSRPDVGLGRWILVAVSLAFEPWIILLGCAGLWSRRREPWTWSLALFILGTLGIHMIVVSQMRYRLPVMPFLIAAACVWIASRLPERSI